MMPAISLAELGLLYNFITLCVRAIEWEGNAIIETTSSGLAMFAGLEMGFARFSGASCASAATPTSNGIAVT
jgi:hypothetical protein